MVGKRVFREGGVVGLGQGTGGKRGLADRCHFSPYRLHVRR